MKDPKTEANTAIVVVGSGDGSVRKDTHGARPKKISVPAWRP